ncbi:MAG: hydrogenase nickel incorporation protein HypB [Chloroflexi bacterium]|nr:hydrogenase nickel incorporation protein HypB [Chloroflexota bacterium]
MKVSVVEGILSANDEIAIQNKQVLDAHGIYAINIMAAPGGGKTSLILRTIDALRHRLRIAVVEGDVASTVDADRVAVKAVPVVQINTGGQCHLEAQMVRRALGQLPLPDLDLLLIENVGNLICPVEFKLGEDLNVMITSVPEGDDKPYKYPGIFVAVDAVIINKIDLLPYVRFDVAAFRKLVQGMNPDVKVFEVSCETGQGIESWAEWVAQQRERKSESTSLYKRGDSKTH